MKYVNRACMVPICVLFNTLDFWRLTTSQKHNVIYIDTAADVDNVCGDCIGRTVDSCKQVREYEACPDTFIPRTVDNMSKEFASN